MFAIEGYPLIMQHCQGYFSAARSQSAIPKEFIERELMQQYLHTWHGFLKRCQRWRQYLHCWKPVADVQLAIFATNQCVDFFHRLICAL